MINIGITGQSGFIGTYLFNHINLYPKEFKTVSFEDAFFDNKIQLLEWVEKCDVIIHLAAMNRHNDPGELYRTNIDLVDKLVNSMKESGSNAHLIFSSSTQEERNNSYGRSKKEGREILNNFAAENNSAFSGLVIPNVYGPFGNPYYNSFIATFSHQLTHDEQPTIQIDSSVQLIYVANLCKFIINRIRKCSHNKDVDINKTISVPFDFEMKVSEILNLLEDYKSQYFDEGIIPLLNNSNEINLFNTFRSYIDHKSRYPVRLIKHSDQRGLFVETIRLGIGGQVSFSTTVKGITRGNHYHTRKIERFTVIKGKALIQLRKIGTNEVFNFELDGKDPSYVDMPIWFTHNIKNIGKEELLTLFWINEYYDSEDPDTFYEEV